MMEEYVCEKKECCRKDKKRCCIDLIVFIISIALAFSVGLLVGALTSIVILISLPAIIVLIAVLVLLLIIRIIMLKCNKKY